MNKYLTIIDVNESESIGKTFIYVSLELQKGVSVKKTLLNFLIGQDWATNEDDTRKLTRKEIKEFGVFEFLLEKGFMVRNDFKKLESMEYK